MPNDPPDWVSGGSIEVRIPSGVGLPVRTAFGHRRGIVRKAPPDPGGARRAYVEPPPANSPSVPHWLPAGLSLSATGAITGIPTAINTNPTTFRVQDSTVPNQQSATSVLTITINAAPPSLLITTASPLPAGTVGAVYGPVTLTATGGTPPYSGWGITPSLPTGLALDPSTGEISGTPDLGTEGITTHTLSVQDSASASASKPNIDLTIDP